MGNTSSAGRGHQEETVDLGYLTPQGIYTGPRDWNQAIVTQLIVDRKLAPFYRPLEDYDESWDDDQIIAAMKEPQQPENSDAESTITRAESVQSSASRTHHKRPSAASKELPRHPEAAVYRGAEECPICFLYYPSNINKSRCCDQAICTECFVQIKRADPTTTHLVSEPACCPYCVQDNFGVVYTPPSWRAGIGSEGWPPPVWTDGSKGPGESSANPTSAMQRRRKSFGADSPDVVTIDQIRPDWEAKLAAVRATVARRANRRIIMRQVGDRLIPVGISSGRVHALPTEEGQVEQGDGSGSNERGSRRSRRRQQNQELNQYLGQMGLGGQDLEELMIMEAMRLSLIEHDEQQRRQREEEEKKKREATAGSQAAPAAIPGTGPSTITASASATTGDAQAPPATTHLISDTPNQTSSATQVAHRSSSSLSRLSARLSPDRSSNNNDRRSPSPIGALGAALRSATSAATAVGSPSPEHEDTHAASGADSSSSIAQLASPDVEPLEGNLVSDIQSSAHSNSSPLPTLPPEVPLFNTADPASEVSPTTSQDINNSGQNALGLGLRPDVQPLSYRSTSFASSILSDTTQNGESYDYLPSSPSSSSSSLAQKPLLDDSTEAVATELTTPTPGTSSLHAMTANE